MPTDATEESFFMRLRYYDDLSRTGFAEIGRILIETERKLLYQHRIDPDTGQPCSFTRWVQLAAPYSYRYCLEARDTMLALADVPAADLAQIPPANLKVMVGLSTTTRNDRGVLAVARSSRADALIEHIKREHPEQHIEAVTRKVFVLTETQAAEVKEALEMAMREFETTNSAEALAGICIAYKASLLVGDYT